MFPVDPLLQKVNRILGKDYTHRTHLETILDLVLLVEQQREEIIGYQLNETLLLDRIKRDTLQIKEMKQNSRLINFYSMAEENLKLAQEVARLKGEVPV